MICFFIGHRDASEDIYAKLREAVADHITEHGVTDFVVGHYGRALPQLCLIQMSLIGWMKIWKTKSVMRKNRKRKILIGTTIATMPLQWKS